MVDDFSRDLALATKQIDALKDKIGILIAEEPVNICMGALMTVLAHYIIARVEEPTQEKVDAVAHDLYAIVCKYETNRKH